MRWLYNGLLSLAYGLVYGIKVFYITVHDGFTWSYNQLASLLGWNRRFHKAEEPIPPDSPLQKVMDFFNPKSWGKGNMYKQKHKEAQAQSDRNFARYQQKKAQSDKNYARFQREKERAEKLEQSIKVYQDKITELNSELSQAKRAQQNQTQGNSSKSDSRSSLQILGLQKGYSDQELKDAYTRLSNRYHPDKHVHMSASFISEAEDEFQKIKSAYDKLK